MKRSTFPYRVFALAAAAAFLASCSIPVAKPAGPASGSTQLPAGPMASVTAARPAPTDTPPPKGLQRPLPTPAPAPAAAADDSDAYYVVTQEGHQGVVDHSGNVVLPFKFASVTAAEDAGSGSDLKPDKPFFLGIPLQTGPANAKRRDSGYLYGASGKMVTSVRLRRAKVLGPDLIGIWQALPGDYVGSNGDYYNRFNNIDDGDNGDGDGAGGGEANLRDAGAILYSGKLVVPYKYTEVFQFGKLAAGVIIGEKGPGTADFYDLKGKLIGSLPSACTYDDSGDYYYGAFSDCMYQQGDYLIFMNPDGKFGALDQNLQWAVQPVWDSVEYEEGAGQFVVKKGDLYGLLDANGQTLLPVEYQQMQYDDATGQYIVEKNGQYGTMDKGARYVIQPNHYELEPVSAEGSVAMYYALSDGGASDLLDAGGMQLLHSDYYNSYNYSNGVIIAQNAASDGSADRSDVYDTQGNFLVSVPGNIQEYLPQFGYFTDGNQDAGLPTSKIYDCNGNLLPLPANSGVTCVTADRFILDIQNTQDDGSNSESYGLCDARGNWIMDPSKYASLTYISGNVLCYGVSVGDDTVYFSSRIDLGLADLDGHLLTGPVFSLFGYCGIDPEELRDCPVEEAGGLYYVSTATMSGLMDQNLRWVWYTAANAGLDEEGPSEDQGE